MMTEACAYLHHTLARQPRFSAEAVLLHDNLPGLPSNGVYVVFENGEQAHGGDRIVRVGTHKKQNNLAARLGLHLYGKKHGRDEPNKDWSIFRKHIGRCLFANCNDEFLSQWNCDRIPRAARDRHSIDGIKQKIIEQRVTDYITENVSFAVLKIDDRNERIRVEQDLLATIYQCKQCGPSTGWLGKTQVAIYHCPICRNGQRTPRSAIISKCGLWNVNDMDGPELSLKAAQQII
jgi:hypothetical protein